MTNVYAYTGQSPKVGYVGYISINQRGNEIEISVRSEGEQAALGVINLTPERCEHLATAILAHINGAPAAAAPAATEPDQRLINLLCRIHRDGGHYIADHGIDKAVDDADVLIAKLNALRDSAPVQAQSELESQNKQLLEALKAIADYPELDALEMKREARAAIAEAGGQDA